MKKGPIIFLLCIVLIMSAVYFLNRGTQDQLVTAPVLEEVEEMEEQEPQLVGGDKDEHGCIGSAGYSWCEVKQKCLRTWEEPCISEDVDEDALKLQVKDQLVAKHGESAESMIINVNRVEGDYATGGAKDVEAMGGGMWFAAQVDGEWKLVWDGNGIILCTDIKPYPNFPVDMIPECYDDTTETMQNRY